MDYALLRKKMVDEQLIPRGIRNSAVLEAFYSVERHCFVPEDLRYNSYGDFPLPIGEGQTISQPYIVALMTELLELRGGEKVLEIGTGSGYQTAILSRLAGEVYSIERFDILAKRAENTLKELGYNNIKAKVDDGTSGWEEFSPFDRIIITAASARVPLPLAEQLLDGGRLVAPLGDSFAQILTLIENKNGRFESRQVCPCAFVPLVGKYA